jgi:hypothetical protein
MKQKSYKNLVLIAMGFLIEVNFQPTLYCMPANQPEVLMSYPNEIGSAQRKVIFQRVPHESFVGPFEFLKKVQEMRFAEAKQMLSANPALKESLNAMRSSDRCLEKMVLDYCSKDTELAVVLEEDKEAAIVDAARPINKQQILNDLINIGYFLEESGIATNYSQLCLGGALLHSDQKAKLMVCMQAIVQHHNRDGKTALMELEIMKSTAEFSPTYLQFFKPLADEIERFLTSENAPKIPVQGHYQRI